MTVYTDGPIDSALFQNNPAPGGFGGIGGGMRNPTPYFPRRVGGLSGFFGGLAGGRMANPPRRMPGGPSKGGNTTPPPIQGPMRGPQMPRPPMQRPGGPGKGRARLSGYGRRGRGRPMPGGPGKGRGQPQQPMTQSPFIDSLGKYPSRPSFDQRMTQGPMNMPQPMGPPNNLQFQQVGNNRPLPSFMGRVGQAFTQGPSSMPQPRMTTFMPTRNMQYGFYGGGITDLY